MMNDEQQLPLISLEEMIEVYQNEQHKITEPERSEVVFDQWMQTRYGISRWLHQNDPWALSDNALALFKDSQRHLALAGSFWMEMMYRWREAENKSAPRLDIMPYNMSKMFKNYLNGPMNVVE